MHIRPRTLPLALATSLLALGPGAAAQGKPCTLEYRRADNMWAKWGSPDGGLGTETITLQPGQKKAFVTDWVNEKKRNDGTTYYGSHLRQAVNRGEALVVVNVRGPLEWLHKPATDLITSTASVVQTFSFIVPGMGTVVANVRPIASQLTTSSFGHPTLQPGDTSFYQHDLVEVWCPDPTATTTAPPPEPPPPTVLLSLTGTAVTPTTTTRTVTVTAQDAKTGGPLGGQVTINGVTGATGQAITFTRCTATIEYEDTRGVTRTRTVRAPCEGTVKISGHADTYFTF